LAALVNLDGSGDLVEVTVYREEISVVVLFEFGEGFSERFAVVIEFVGVVEDVVGERFANWCPESSGVGLTGDFEN